MIIPLSVVHLLIAGWFRFTVLGVAGHSEVAVGAIRNRPLVSIVIKVYLGWRSASCLVIGVCPSIGVRKVRGVSFWWRGQKLSPYWFWWHWPHLCTVPWMGQSSSFVIRFLFFLLSLEIDKWVFDWNLLTRHWNWIFGSYFFPDLDFLSLPCFSFFSWHQFVAPDRPYRSSGFPKWLYVGFARYW